MQTEYYEKNESSKRKTQIFLEDNLIITNAISKKRIGGYKGNHPTEKMT